jgi:hypothetical protein
VFELYHPSRALLLRSSWWFNFHIRCWSRGTVALLVRYSRLGWPLSCSRLLVDPSEPTGSLATLDREVNLMLQKKAERRVNDPSHGGFVDPVFSQEYPTLWDHLTQRKWDDGSERRTSTITLFADGACAKGLLKDRDAGLCLWIAAPTLLGLFEALELALCDAETEWRVDRQFEGQPAKRVKRGR